MRVVVARREELLARSRALIRAGAHWRRSVLLPGVILGLAAIVLLWTRVLPLSQSQWADEIVTTSLFSGPGPSGIWHGYFANDHMFFELLAWITNAITGDHSTAAYRFWGVVPGVGAGALMAWWLWRRVDRWVAAMFGVLATASPLYYVLVTEERGYGLAFLAAVLVLIGADRFVRLRDRASLALFVAGSLIGIWTLPVFVLPVMATTGLMLVAAFGERRAIVVALITVAVASLLFYAPVLHDVLTASKQQFGQPLPWHGFVTGPFEDLLAPEILALVHGRSTVLDALAPGAETAVAGTAGIAAVAAAATVAIGFAVAVRNRTRRFLALASLVPAFFSYTVLDIAQLHTVNRFASFLMLPLLLLCAFAFVAAGRALARLPRGAALAGAVAIAFSLFALQRADALLGIVLRAPYENDQELAELVSAIRPTSVITNDTAGDLFFYLGPVTPPQASAAQLESLFCSRAAPFVYLDELRNSAAQPSTACLRARGAVKIAVAQRHYAATPAGQLPPAAAGAPFVAWLVPGRASPPPVPRAVRTPEAVGCTPRMIQATFHTEEVAGPGQPVDVPLQSGAGPGSDSAVLTLTRALLLGSVQGADVAAGATFTSQHGFIAIEYRLRNDGPAAVTPSLAVNGVYGLSGDFAGGEIGALHPNCAAAAASFAARAHLANPQDEVAPGATSTTVALYPLPSLTSVTPYILSWIAPPGQYPTRFALPDPLTAHG